MKDWSWEKQSITNFWRDIKTLNLKLKSNKKLKSINSKKTCKDILQVRDRDQEQLKVLELQWWVEMLVVDPECQLLNHLPGNKAEVSIGKQSLNAFQLAKLIQQRLNKEQSYGEVSITMEMDTVHSLSARRDFVMLSRMINFLRPLQLSWEHSNLLKMLFQGRKVTNTLTTTFKNRNSESSSWPWDNDLNTGKPSGESTPVVTAESTCKNSWLPSWWLKSG